MTCYNTLKTERKRRTHIEVKEGKDWAVNKTFAENRGRGKTSKQIVTF